MALSIDYEWNSNGIRWKSGYFYKFRYNAWRNDPEPLVIVLYRIRGIHPTSGHQWNLIQAINFNYIPQSHRKMFLKIWMNYYTQMNGNIRFTYQNVSRQFPFLKFGIRRYVLKPDYRIQRPVVIDPENIEGAVVSSFDKDFSDKVKMDLVQKYNRVSGRVATTNKKTVAGINGMPNKGFGMGIYNIFKNIFKKKR